MSKPDTFAARAAQFYRGLSLPARFENGVETLNPYSSPEVLAHVDVFFKKFFNDRRMRIGVFGINPGRFGAGITGINFTDPVALDEECGIPNNFDKRKETSSDFVYRVARMLGGPETMYRDFFYGAVSPLGFVRGGINFNFYDDPAFYRELKPFIIDSIQKQIALGLSTKSAIVLGSGTNARIFNELNDEHGFFEAVHVLEHPRYILQYKRKELDAYLEKYRDTFAKALSEAS